MAAANKVLALALAALALVLAAAEPPEQQLSKLRGDQQPQGKLEAAGNGPGSSAPRRALLKLRVQGEAAAHHSKLHPRAGPGGRPAAAAKPKPKDPPCQAPVDRMATERRNGMLLLGMFAVGYFVYSQTKDSIPPFAEMMGAIGVTLPTSTPPSSGGPGGAPPTKTAAP